MHSFLRISNVILQTGSCGQLLTAIPTLEHGQPMLPMPSTTANTNVTSASRAQVAATQNQVHYSVDNVVTSGDRLNSSDFLKQPPSVVAASQIPSTYVCSPIPGQQPIQMRVAPSVMQAAPEQAFLHPAAYSQQVGI